MFYFVETKQFNMKRETLKELYLDYELTADDVFKHQHYTIITRSGIEKIQAKESLNIKYEVVRSEPNFAAVKATVKNSKDLEIETFGSALRGADHRSGNCNTWYVLEMAEKRALSRAVLKITGFYQLGVFGEDESESFKKPNNG